MLSTAVNPTDGLRFDGDANASPKMTLIRNRYSGESPR
jgi:hypothetical protein